MRQVLFFVFCSGFFRGIKSQPLLLAQPPAGGALSWSSYVTGFHSGWLALLLFLYKEEEAASKIPCCGGILQELDSQLSFSHKKHQKQSKTFTVTPEYLFKSSNKCCVTHRQHFQVLTSLFFLGCFVWYCHCEDLWDKLTFKDSESVPSGAPG